MKIKDHRPKIEIIISEPISNILNKCYINCKMSVSDYNKMFELAICEVLNQNGIDATYCRKCRELKLSSEFSDSHPHICNTCVYKQDPRGLPTDVRKNVIEKTEGKCAVCGGKGDQIHHVAPKSFGGSDELDNLVFVCSKCHLKAHNGNFTRQTGYNSEIFSDTN